ncbi:MAG: ABC transporter permease [Acidimicrobiia bacterium]
MRSLLNRLRTAMPALLTVVLLIILWEVWVRAFDIPRFLVPAPSSVFAEIWSRPGFFWEHLLFTAAETGLGFLLAILIGFPLGVLVVESKIFVRTIYPIIVASQAVPKLAVAPLFLIWFGLGLESKVLIAALIAFFPILIGVVVGLQSVDRGSLLLGRSIGLSRLGVFSKIRMPFALPSTFGGLKVGMTLAVVGAVVGEFLGSTKGLGSLLVIAAGTLNTPLVFATLVVLSVLGVVAYWLIEVIERLVLPWQEEVETGGTTQLEVAA